MTPVTTTGHTSVAIGVNVNLDFVNKFCYLDDATVETIIHIGWNTFRQLVPLLTNKEGYIIDSEREIVQQFCERKMRWHFRRHR